MMHEFTYCIPTEVVFGKDSLQKLPAMLKNRGISRLLLVCGGKSARKSGLLDRIFALLNDADVQYDVLEGVQPNPRVDLVRVGVQKALALDAQLILGVGGGSALDTAKAVAHGTANPETDVWEFWKRRVPLTKTLPVGAVLTIPAAGSETSDSSVLTNEAEGEKRGFNTELNRPAFAILDPSLAATLPRRQAACGVTDILMHTLDRYFNPATDNEMTDQIAEAVMRVVVKFGPRVCKDPGDYEAMSEIMWAGSLSHNGLTGLGGSKDFSTHQLGHTLGEKFDVYHGESLSAVWGSWARYVCSTDPARFARLAKNVWGAEETPEAGIEATVSFFRSLGMPTSIAELPCGKQDEAGQLDLAERCSFGRSRTIGSFRKLGYDDILAIYRMANEEGNR